MKYRRLFFILPLIIFSNTHIFGAHHNYAFALHLSTYFLGAQRCGDNHSWIHDQCHWRDGEVVGLDLTGGWHDSGDHVKFNFTMNFAVVTLLLGYLQYPSVYPDDYSPSYSSPPSDGIPDILNEVKFATDYMLKCLTNNNFYFQVGTCGQDHNSFSEPNYQSANQTVAEGGNPRGVFLMTTNQAGANIAGGSAAALALMAQAYQTYDATYANLCLVKAQEYYAFAKKLNGATNIDNTSGDGWAYEDWSWADNMAMAAIELYNKTGITQYLTEAENYYDNGNFDDSGNDVTSEANWTYYVAYELYKKTGTSKYLTLMNNRMNNNYSIDATYGWMYWSDWGSLGMANNAAFEGVLYNLTTGSTQAYSFAKRQVDFTLGTHPSYTNNNNYPSAPTNHSFLIGYTDVYVHRYTQYPQHCSSFGKQGNAWDLESQEASNPGSVPFLHLLKGSIVGGPGKYDMIQDTHTPEITYQDNISDYVQNEPSITYNVGFVSAVAFVKRKDHKQFFVLAATAINSNKIELKWNDVTNETGYKLYRNEINNFTTATLFAHFMPNKTSYTDSELIANTTYYYWISATNTSETIDTSGAYAITYTGMPAVTTILTINSESTNQINLIWSDVQNETGYQIYRSLDNVFSEASLIHRTAKNITNYSDTKLTQNTKYFYWIVATNSMYTGNPSFVNSATTLSNIYYGKKNTGKIIVTPNPSSSSESVLFYFWTSAKTVQFEIYTITGEIVWKSKQINLGQQLMEQYVETTWTVDEKKEIQPGTYFVVCKEAGYINKKVITIFTILK